MSLTGDGLRNSLTRRGERSDRAWRAIRELPEDDQRATLGYLVDHAALGYLVDQLERVRDLADRRRRARLAASGRQTWTVLSHHFCAAGRSAGS
jgi:hypothetical protein